MPGPAPNTGYVGYNPSPAGIPETTSPHNERFDMHANADDFGAGIGRAMEGVGKQFGQTADEASNLALKYQGQINETLSTNAETQFIQQAGERDAKFKSLEGMAAVDAAPQHVADLTALQQNIRKDLPRGAARAFDQLTERQLAYRVNEANLYVAQQIKSADLNSAKDQIATSVASAADMGIATNDKEFDGVLQNIHFGQGRQMQNQGWDSGSGMQQNQDGEHTFDETSPHGADAKKVYDQLTNTNVSKAWENRLKSIAENSNIMDAYQKYKDNYDRIPSAGHVAMDAYFAPKIRDAQSRGISEHVLGQQTTEYNNQVYSHSTSPYNIGNVKTQSGAQLGTPSFVQPKTPEDGVVLAANNLRTNYQGLTLAQIGAKWAPSQENDTGSWVNNVSAASGIDKNAVPNLNDPAQLKNLVHGIGVAEKTPQDLANFTPAVLESGVNRSIAGEKLSTGVEPSNGKMQPSIADFYKTNYATVLDNARNMAEQAHPGDIEFAEKAEAHTKQRMDAVIQQDKLAVEAQQNTVLKAVNGELSKGQKPQTLDQMIGISPEVKTAWDSLQMNNPKAAELIEKKMIGAKTGKDLGGGFSYLQQDVLTGKLDVNDLLYHVGDDLSQAGFDKLHGAIKNKTPDEMNENDRMAKFLKNGHDQILHSGLFGNTPEAEDAYQNWFASVDAARKKGEESKIPLEAMLDKNSKDYLGKNIHQFAIPVQKQLQDRADRINGRLQNAEAVTDDRKRQPDETPEQYLARVK